MSKSMAESMDELATAVDVAKRELIGSVAGTRVGRFFGWFYEWERPRIGDRLARIGTIMLAVNVLYLWPVALIEWALRTVLT